MSDSTLYDDDILLWSEQQAEVIRRLRRTVRDLPNDLDIENVAEEIESVGRSELAAVKSYLRLILSHLIKLALRAGCAVSPTLAQEAAVFHADLLDRYAPSMQQRIDIDEVWQSARNQVALGYEGTEEGRLRALSDRSPFSLDQILARYLEIPSLIEQLRSM